MFNKISPIYCHKYCKWNNRWRDYVNVYVQMRKLVKKLTRSIIKRVGETNHIPSQNGLNHHWVDTKKEEMSAYILVFLVNKFHPHLLSLTSILHFLLCICLNIIENFCTFLYQSLWVNISLFSTIFFYYIKTVYGLISNYWFSGIKKKNFW